ncbi:MAG TPA: LysM domain-containing protein [Anaerolineales bacterium]|nr:LysM domain-containing protein [Anaerolineales bacterium]
MAPMTGSRSLHFNLAIWVILIVGLVACGPDALTPTLTATRRVTLTPYLTVTPSRTLHSSPAIVRTSTPRPSPTATPITYKVVRGDTMLGIALRYGISLEDLLAANMGVDPQFLSVGAELVIPLGDSAPAVLATATPLPIRLEEPVCYITTDGGVYCFLLATNPLARPVENLLAHVRLIATDGDTIADGEAIPPLNLLQPHAALPLVIFFQPDLFAEYRTKGGSLKPEGFSVEATLLSALQLSTGDERYAKPKAPEVEVEIDPSGLQALIRGFVSLKQSSPPAGQVWVAVVAYDESGNVVGLRKWEAFFASSETPVQAVSPPVRGTPSPEPVSPQTSWSIENETRRLLNALLKPGERLEFTISVYSLGPRIERVEVLVEARPLSASLDE